MLEALGALYARGDALDWHTLYPDGGRCVQLPTYPWQRERLWLDWLETRRVSENPSGLGEVSENPSGLGEVSENPSDPAYELLRQLEQAPQGKRQAVLRAHVRDQVAQVLGLDPAHSLDPQQGLFDAGLNSLAAVELVNRLRTSLGRSLPLTCVFDYPTVEALSGYLAREVLALESTASAAPSAYPETRRVFRNPSGLAQEATLDAERAEPMTLTQLEQLSEDEAEALLIKKLEAIGRNL
jgi:acyl transferase domain-containing protein